jgi:hypothetical protein
MAGGANLAGTVSPDIAMSAVLLRSLALSLRRLAKLARLAMVLVIVGLVAIAAIMHLQGLPTDKAMVEAAGGPLVGAGALAVLADLAAAILTSYLDEPAAR